jgi:DinB superfamily
MQCGRMTELKAVGLNRFPNVQPVLSQLSLPAEISASTQKINPNHYSCIYAIMQTLTEFNLAEAIAVLARTPTTLDALLRGLPDSWVRRNEGLTTGGKESWSPFDIVGHLIVGERTDWMARARIILEHGEARPFDPFDRLAQVKESQGKSLDQLLDEFAHLREGNLAALQALNLQPKDLARRGMHPELGVVTLAELLATWAVHDLTHLHQLSRVMAYQYQNAVGPWSAYLGVLHCNGHSG